MKHTSQSTIQPCNPDALLKAERHHDALFRAIFDGVTKTPRGDSAFQAVADGLSTYGRATHTNWDFDAAAAKQQGNKATRPISKAERRDKRQSASWVRDFVPATVRPDYPVAKQDRNVGVVAAGSQDHKRFRVEVTMPNGEREEILCSLITNTIHVLSYGKIVEFRHSSRASGTFLDCRDGKRKPLSFAKSELHRFVGLTEGDRLFAELTTFPKGKAKCNPATLSPTNPPKVGQSDTVVGHTVAGLQKRQPTLWEQRKAAARAV